MNRSVFMRWRRGMRTAPREESGVSAASTCDCVRPRNWRQAGGYDYFATTLTISPLKNAAKINEIGQALSGEYAISLAAFGFQEKERL